MMDAKEQLDDIYAQLHAIADFNAVMLCGTSIEALERMTEINGKAADGEISPEEMIGIVHRRLTFIRRRLNVILERRQAKPIFEWIRNEPRLVELDTE